MATNFITVSINIMHDTKLNQSQKFLLAEIEQLSQLQKGCIASNNHFAELIGITKENVSRNLNDLEKKGYINIKIINGTRNHERIITITNLVRPPYQNRKTPLSKQQETKENITINKTINNSFLEEEAFNYDNYLIKWNDLTNKSSCISKILKITKNRKAKLLTRSKDFKDFSLTYKTAIEIISKSTYLTQNDLSWFSFDWLIDNDTNIVKVIEGKYSDKNQGDW